MTSVCLYFDRRTDDECLPIHQAHLLAKGSGELKMNTLKIAVTILKLEQCDFIIH